ncbi:MAG TPA: DUF5715 family protein [Patescibacteria group bacterium]|nr:DUF5715 family protein [Patescibacteria group bacterium]
MPLSKLRKHFAQFWPHEVVIAIFLLAILMVITFRDKGCNQSPREQKVILPRYFTSDYPVKFSKENLIAGAIKTYDPIIFNVKRNGGPQAMMERIDQYDLAINAAANKHGVDALTLKGIIYLESGGDIYALSGSSCAGIAQFSPSTARGYGLKVAGNWYRFYLRFKKSGADKDAITLSRIDERFDPIKAIGAQAAYIASLQQKYGEVDFAVAGYHMGGSNLSNVIREYRAGWQSPEKITWEDIVFDASPSKHPKTHRLLFHELEDYSWSYYFRVRSAMKARSLWKMDKAVFAQKVEQLNNPIRRTQLVTETIWYPEEKMPQYTMAQVERWAQSGLFAKIEPSDFLNIQLNKVSAPYLSQNAAGVLYHLAGQMRQVTGHGITVNSALRTYEKQIQLVRQGLSPSVYSSHLWGEGIDIDPYNSDKLNDQLSWFLDQLKWRGDIVWYREGNHFHITVAPNEKFVTLASRAILNLHVKQAEESRFASK